MPLGMEKHPEMKAKVYNIQTITPIFGGGVEPGVNDSTTVIRPPSVRGHLRFWWRATRGARFETVPELRQREGEIWGTTDHPSPVWIKVVLENYATPSECASYKWDPNMRYGKGGYRLKWSSPFDTRDSPMPYVLFPFQGKAPGNEDSKDPSKMIKSAQFKLITCIPTPERMSLFTPSFDKQRDLIGMPRITDEDKNIEKDIESAIWAWITFGGIGARTRRGCGALYCVTPKDLTPPSHQEFKDWLIDRYNYYGLTRPESIPSSVMDKISFKVGSSTKISATEPLCFTRKWSILGKIILKEGENSISCWEESIKVMKDFRQGSEGRDNGATKRPSRSRLPEPESIRKIFLEQKKLTSRPKWMHPLDKRIKNIAFPRAEFGMPIIIEIRREDIKPTLQPSNDCDRMASPLILKPIKFSDGRFGSMIIRLGTSPLDSAYIKPGKNDLESARSISSLEIRDTDPSAVYQDSPIYKFSSTGSALDAFMSFAISHKFEEVLF